MKFYTRTGDTGDSDLIGGIRAKKFDPRFDVLGGLDELNSFLGMLKCALKDKEEVEFVECLQREIITLSSHLASLGSGQETEKFAYKGGFTEKLEGRIDHLQSFLPKEFKFVLPGANEASARADAARTVARRAERSLALLAADGYNVSPEAGKLVNRLSDYLYALGRVLEL